MSKYVDDRHIAAQGKQSLLWEIDALRDISFLSYLAL